MGNLRSFKCAKGLRLDVPVRVGQGKGRLELSEGIRLGWEQAPMSGSGGILLEARAMNAHISIGAGTMLSNNVSLVAMESINIGQNCLIGDMTLIFDCDFHEIDPDRRHSDVGPIEPVIIGDNVWIGSRVIVLRGVTIGNNCVIGAGSVITTSIPENSLAAGVPAKVIRAV